MWCLQEDVPLVKHHYPVPQSEGGTETVRICRNCHGKAHTHCFIDATGARTPEEYEARVAECLDRMVQETFPGLWESGWHTFPAGKLYTLTPPWMWKGLTDQQAREASDTVNALRGLMND